MAFKKGQSGNPQGRKPGATPAIKLRKIIADNIPDILYAMIEQAKAGDVPAAKALLDKVVPSLKPQALPVSVESESGLVAQGEAVINETLAGNIPPDIGSLLITSLSSQSKLIEIEELNKRLERIESLLQEKK